MMKQSLSPFSAVAWMLALAACQDSSSPVSSASTIDVSSAFNSLPVGFSDVQSTFDDTTGTDWTPGRVVNGFHHGGGPDAGGRGDGMMCGGLGGFLDIGLGFGSRGLMGGDSLTNCAFDAATGRVACAPKTRDGLTISRSVAYTDASGAVQEEFDSTTNTVNVQMQVSGTRERRDGSSTTVEHSSDRTVSGLAQGSARRSIDGTSAGKETTTGSDSVGTFNAVRIIGDTIQGVIIPTSSDSASYPTAGTVVRSMQVTATYEGQTPTTSSRREVITFDGSNTAAVVITKDGNTQTCTLSLQGHQLTCS
jgi:hypothetical protein